MHNLSQQRVETQAMAIKKALALALADQLGQTGVTVAALARRMGTSRTAVQRVLNRKNTSITLTTLVAAASAAGMKLELNWEPRIEKIEEVETPPEIEPLLARMNAATERVGKFSRKPALRLEDVVTHRSSRAAAKVRC
jgi:transcriptional regulator with XRE-family HTH domain